VQDRKPATFRGQDFRPLPIARGQVLDRVETLVLSPIRDAACYRLRDIPDGRHETGWSLRDFGELVGIITMQDRAGEATDGTSNCRLERTGFAGRSPGALGPR